MDFAFWVGVVGLFFGTFSIPAVAALVMTIYFNRADREWTRNNRVLFPWRPASVAAIAAVVMLGYLMFGVKPVVGWLGPRLIGINNRIEPIYVTRSTLLDAKTNFWASAMSSDRQHMNDSSSVDVAVWVTRDRVTGPCSLNRDDYRIAISSAGFNVPNPVKQDAQSGHCGIGLEWSITPKQSGTNVIEVGLEQRIKGNWRSVSFPLVVTIVHKQTLAERLGWLQSAGILFVSPFLGTVAKRLVERALVRRNKKAEVKSPILRP